MATHLGVLFDKHSNVLMPHPVADSFDVLAPNFDHDVALIMTEIALTSAFRVTLKLLRSSMLVPRHQDVVLFQDVATVNSATAWIPWLSLLHSWARRFCFLAGDCGDCDAMMFTQIKHLENVGIELRFVLSNSNEPAVLKDREWFGDYLRTSPNRKFKYKQHRLCMCIVLRMPDNTVDWDELQRLWKDRHNLVSNATPSQRLVRYLLDECDKVKCAHGVIMDSEHTLIMLVPEPTNPSSRRPFRVTSCQLFTSAEHSSAFCVAQIITKYSPSLGTRRPILCSGATAQKEVALPPARATRFRDFDYYELSRGGAYLRHFLEWKERESAGVSTLCVGDVLSVTDRYSVPRRLIRWHSHFPRYPLAKEERIQLNPWIERRRLRDRTTNDLLLKSPALAFRVTGVIQDGPDHYSRVVRGRLQAPGTTASSGQTLVLKLIDERFFPMKLENFELDPKSDLKTKPDFWVNFADQLLRREDSAYRRMHKFQGALMPHYYGCHEFQLPDGRKVLGIILEDIEGKTLDEVIKIETPYEEVKSLYACIRGFIRALNHSGITQTDWHLDQIICERYTIRSLAGGLVEGHRPVFLDFAFATQSSGRTAMMEEPEDVAEVGFLLGVVGEVEEELNWYERDICE